MKARVSEETIGRFAQVAQYVDQRGAGLVNPRLYDCVYHGFYRLPIRNLKEAVIKFAS